MTSLVRHLFAIGLASPGISHTNSRRSSYRADTGFSPEQLQRLRARAAWLRHELGLDGLTFGEQELRIKRHLAETMERIIARLEESVERAQGHVAAAADHGQSALKARFRRSLDSRQKQLNEVRGQHEALLAEMERRG